MAIYLTVAEKAAAEAAGLTEAEAKVAKGAGIAFTAYAARRQAPIVPEDQEAERRRILGGMLAALPGDKAGEATKVRLQGLLDPQPDAGDKEE